MNSYPVIHFTEAVYPPPQSVLTRLAKALQFCLHIPQDDSLVCVLGFGWEKTNTQALETWIRNTLTAPDDEGVRLVLPWLIERLERDLLGMEASL